MRCWAGCQAWIRTSSSIPENIGAVVTCVRLVPFSEHGNAAAKDQAVWFIETKQPLLGHACMSYLGQVFSLGLVRMASGYERDSNLTPIYPPPQVDAVTTVEHSVHTLHTQE